MIGLPVEESEVSNAFQKFKEKVKSSKKLLISLGAIVVFLIVLGTTNGWGYLKLFMQSTENDTLCPLYEPVVPKSFLADNSSALEILYSEDFKKASIEKLSKAVQVDTQIQDNQADVPDAPEQWVQFIKFHKYLNETFPTVFGNMTVEYVNTYGIVLTWAGSNDKLKPVLLMAHQDTVPVQAATLDDWTYPPFSGHYDGKYVYGRGASDCKNVLVAIMETFEYLLSKDHKPSRTIMASFGFDEEASGIRGASALAKFIEKKLGKNSIYAVIDEGSGLSYDDNVNQVVAQVATGEKGYADLEIQLSTPGGHSSVPPDHTSIGIMSELVYAIEQDKYSPILTEKNPILKYMQCLAVNTGDKLPKLTRKAILRAGFDKLANSKVVESLSKVPLVRYLIQTSQAADIVNGGEKANALPESTRVVVNHRVAVEYGVSDVADRMLERVLLVAKKHGLGVESFGEKVLEGDGVSGEFNLHFYSTPLEPAPVSPTDDNVWKHLAGTTRHVFEDIVYRNLTYPILTLPLISPGNTDTRYYWNLTRNIYRYSPFFVKDMIKENHIHSVDEKIQFEGHLELILFFYEYLQNIDTEKADN